jgi:hypothetical protein
MTILLDVRQGHIDQANEYRREHGLSGAWCPIACALRDHFPGRRFYSANADGVEAAIYGHTFRGATNDAMRSFMRRWDRTGSARPTRFRALVRVND